MKGYGKEELQHEWPFQKCGLAALATPEEDRWGEGKGLSSNLSVHMQEVSKREVGLSLCLRVRANVLV